MASLRDIRRQIAAVKNINKITQAMKMVAAAKLRRAQDRVAAARPYAERMRDLLAQVTPHVPPEVVERHRLLQRRDDPRVGLVVLTSDRGLAGSYNNNIIRMSQRFMDEQRAEGREVELITIGRKGTNTLRSRGYTPAQSFRMVDVDTPFDEVQAITRAVVDLYARREEPVSAVYIAYTVFINAVTQRATLDPFLPIEATAVTRAAAEAEAAAEQVGSEADVDYEFDPDAEQLLEILLPRFVDNQVYQYLLEATASEYGARMTAMSQASDNATEMIGNLTLQYNRARQDAITKEILDIVGGAEALASE